MNYYKNPFQPLFILFIFTLIIHPNYSFSQEWQFKKEDKGIRVYVRSQESTNLKELKITKIFKGDLNTIARVLADVSEYPKWVYKCAKSKTIQTNNEWDIYFYSETQLPWPMQNRDVILHSTLFIDNQSGSLVSVSKSIDGIEKKQPGIIRIPHLESVWTFKPRGNGLIQMTYLLNSEPGGNIPDWLVNLAIDEGPVQTIKRFMALLENEKYRFANYSDKAIPFGRQ